MSELTTQTIVRNDAAQHEPWNPGGSLIAMLIGGIALFFVASMITLVGACALTLLVDVPH